MRVNFNQPVVNTEKKTVHNLIIMDSSGSMQGGKWAAAVKFINNEIERYKTETLVNVIHSIVIFSGSSAIKFRNWREANPITVNSTSEFIGDMTALNDAIGNCLIKALIENRDEQLLVKIFTDGQENASRQYSAADARDLIKSCEDKGWTITFGGTDVDVQMAQRLYGIDASNTIVHDNTPTGIDEMNYKYGGDTTAYFTNVAEGKDVTRGFFKQINKTENEN